MACGSLSRRVGASLLFPLGLALCGCPSPGGKGEPPAATPTPAGVAAGNGDGGVAGGGITFREATADSGIDYRWKLPDKPVGNILDLIGNGCAFLDFDNDGNLDVLLVGQRVALYRGDGKGKFAPAPLPPLKGHFLGCATGDFNGDGFPDVYLTAYRGGTLLRNDGGKGFTDVTPGSGLAPQPWGTAASFADLDGDGNQDLFVGNYVKFGPETVPQLCKQKGFDTACAPRQYPPERSALYAGDGKGRFRDVTQAAGFDKLSGKALGVAIADYDGSGRPSVSVANDEMPGDLMKNRGGWKFENIAAVAGTATDLEGNVHGGMGTAWGDVDGDGRLDLFVATYQNEPKNVYRNDGDDLFTDRSPSLGLQDAHPMVSFGACLADFDNDGVTDLAVANGHVQDNIAKIDARTTFEQATLFYRGVPGKPFQLLNAALPKDVTRPIVGRGLARGDYDNDGRTDLLVVDSHGPPLLLRNETPAPGNWLGVTLRDKNGKIPLGATLTLTVGDRTLVRHYHTDGSYMSASDPRVVFGLGTATRADRLTVRWPNGGETTHADLPTNQYMEIRQKATGNRQP
jgi:enediyne biosynthesis protein E4